MNVPLLFYEGTGQAPARMGLAHPSICPYGAFALADGALVLIAIQNEREWASSARSSCDEPDLPKRPGFETNVIRVANRAMVDGHIARGLRDPHPRRGGRPSARRQHRLRLRQRRRRFLPSPVAAPGHRGDAERTRLDRRTARANV